MLTFPITFNSGNRFTNYTVFNFEDNLTSNTGLTFSNDSTPGSWTYGTGKIGSKCLEFVTNSGVRYFKLSNPGSEFRLDWSNPFCFSFWASSSTATNGVTISLMTTTGSYTTTNLFYELEQRLTAQRFSNYYTAGSTSPNEVYQPTFTSLNTNTWNFFYWRYDPAENKKIYLGRNAETELSYTFTNNLESTTYTSNFTLGIGRETASSGATIKLDQLTLHHTTPRNRAYMLSVYNSGNGVTLI